MPKNQRPRLVWLTTDYPAAALIFIFALIVFWFSPVHQVTDSHYSMLLSEGLLKHRSFALDHYNLPRLQPSSSTRDYYVMNGNIWQQELAGNHIYYYFPPGSSVLSVPYVAMVNALGISAANADGTYNPLGEIRIETTLAAILMALLAVIFYLSSRVLLPVSWSLVIALAAAFGTQVWSTASRGLWSHTWASLLVGLVVWILVAGEADRRRMKPILLATLLAWLYFVRPTGSIVIATVSVYLLLFQRTLFARFATTGVVWLVAFVFYSWSHFGKLLPSYYQTSRLRFDLFPVAFAGNVLSPSRGLLVYVPALLFVLYLIVRYWKHLPLVRLVWLSSAICILHIVSVSAFANLWGDWWGGASFGPRYSTELVPWYVLLAIIGVRGRLDARRGYESERATQADSMRYSGPAQADSMRYSVRNLGEMMAGVVLVGLSVFINARGATALETWKWSQPSTDQQLRARLWDWRHPQFLAGLQSPPPPVEFPLVQNTTTISLTEPEAGKYLWYGWSGAEKDIRWTDGREAALVFSLNELRDMSLVIEMGPFLSARGPFEQRVMVSLNHQALESLILTDGTIKTYSIKLPGHVLTSRNVLTFTFPDAASPASVGAGMDDRLLGIKVKSMLFQ